MRSELCECSEPDYWQLLHHDYSCDSASEHDDPPAQDGRDDVAAALQGYAEARESALARAYEGLRQAEVHSEWDAMERYNDAINLLALI